MHTQSIRDKPENERDSFDGAISSNGDTLTIGKYSCESLYPRCLTHATRVTTTAWICISLLATAGHVSYAQYATLRTMT